MFLLCRKEPRMSFRAERSAVEESVFYRFLHFVPTPAKGVLGQASRDFGRNDRMSFLQSKMFFVSWSLRGNILFYVFSKYSYNRQ
jgi:hypothetical protein